MTCCGFAGGPAVSTLTAAGAAAVGAAAAANCEGRLLFDRVRMADLRLQPGKSVIIVYEHLTVRWQVDATSHDLNGEGPVKWRTSRHGRCPRATIRISCLASLPPHASSRAFFPTSHLILAGSNLAPPLASLSPPCLSLAPQVVFVEAGATWLILNLDGLITNTHQSQAQEYEYRNAGRSPSETLKRTLLFLIRA